MAVEIERKFLLASDAWRDRVEHSMEMKQGYLSRDAQSSVRVRICEGRAQLGVKSTRDGIYRLEYEYEIPLEEAEELLRLVAHRPIIHKTRHILHHAGHRWEIDEFHGENAGLVVAEVELASREEPFEKPAWLGREVSTDARYYNSNLSKVPYSAWKDDA
ncbi:MAG TPA: CYTH domain-containing protein [Thiolapillus brandeum]|uniref:CYTH domain-containing protein n=1 Tax=Thiolapillus brandeum TaxID=1076588 RepID=A0A7C5N2X9_9GAMM|nr:CYTH domain-containing protein [Thiolapillus brandeum]